MRRAPSTSLATAAALLLCCAGRPALGQDASYLLRRRLQQAKPDDPFPEGPNVVCWNYTIDGEKGADLTPDQVGRCVFVGVVCGGCGSGVGLCRPRHGTAWLYARVSD